MINEFKVGDVIKNVKAVLISDGGWIFTLRLMNPLYFTDVTYPAGDYWIVESIGERYCLIHMSGQKVKTGLTTLQWNFRLD